MDLRMLPAVDRRSLFAAAYLAVHPRYRIELELPHEAHFVARTIYPILAHIAAELRRHKGVVIGCVTRHIVGVPQARQY